MQDDDDAQLTQVDDLTTDPLEQEALASTTQGGMLANMENMIKNNQLQIDQGQEELKKYSDMLQGVFVNDERFQQLDETVKTANKAKSAYKSQILKLQQNADLVAKIKDLKTNLREVKDALSDYLREYQRMSGSNVVEGYDGQLREIVYTAKLVRKSDKRP